MVSDMWILALTLGCEENRYKTLPAATDTAGAPDSGFTDPCTGIECGDNASCQSGACSCDEGFYGDPDVGCESVEPHTGWIGSPCPSDDACDYDDGWCITDYPDGHCTQTCEQYCPDADGMPTTFCIEPDDRDGGHCFSRCDFSYYPLTDGCRPDYTCVERARYSSSSTELTCVPSDWVIDEPCQLPLNLEGSDECYLELVSFADPVLRDLVEKLLSGTADSIDAIDFLDENYAASQAFISDELDVTIHDNATSGHSESSPMRGAIVHYTAAQREDSTIKYFVGSDPHASTHFVIGSYRNGLPVQLFSHEDRTWHAGSTYNIDRFGIDFANAGYLTAADGGGWETYSGAEYTMFLPLYGSEPVYVTGGIPGADSGYAAYEYWQPYTIYQLLSYVLVGRALHLAYGLQEDAIERHGDVSDSRVDPGPNLPLTYLNELVFSAEDVFAVAWLEEYRTDTDWIGEHPEAR